MLEEILIALQTVSSAQATEVAAEQAYAAINASVAQATTAETALFEAQQATYEAAITIVRNGLGWTAALAALQQATSARTEAENAAVELMRTFVATNPV
jgi:hypothetical protein